MAKCVRCFAGNSVEPGITFIVFKASSPENIKIWAVSGENQQCGCRTGLTQTKLFKHKRWLDDGNFRLRKKRNCTIHVAKKKALISFAATAKLICGSVFAYAKC